MIEDQFVPLNIARQIVSIGFNEDCFGEYFTDGTISFTSGKNTFHEAVKLNKVIACIAPTYYQAQRWLRDVHNIEIEVYREVNFADEVYYNTYCVDVFNNKLSFQSKDSIFTERIDTYEQALEIGLLEGLKLINV